MTIPGAPWPLQRSGPWPRPFHWDLFVQTGQPIPSSLVQLLQPDPSPLERETMGPEGPPVSPRKGRRRQMANSSPRWLGGGRIMNKDIVITHRDDRERLPGEAPCSPRERKQFRKQGQVHSCEEFDVSTPGWTSAALAHPQGTWSPEVHPMQVIQLTFIHPFFPPTFTESFLCVDPSPRGWGTRTNEPMVVLLAQDLHFRGWRTDWKQTTCLVGNFQQWCEC